MRILWATPFNEQSAIARFSAEVTAALAQRGYEIDIRRTEIGDAATLPPPSTRLRVLDAGASCEAGMYDLAVLNLGNYAPFHASGMQVIAETAPLMIFHDAEMRDFARGVQQIGQDESWIVEGSKKEASTLLSSFASLACGAIVHGPHYAASVEAACPGPVRVIQLCFPDIGAVDPVPRQESPARLMVFGHINPNKQIDRVLTSLANVAKSAPSDLELRIVGPCLANHRRAYSQLASELGLRPPIFFGQVSDSELCRLLATSDIVLCLRYPITEGGSASLATALYSARPVVVSDTASYSLIPDDCVWKVSFGTRTDDLTMTIEGILSDQYEAETRARLAKRWCIDAYSPVKYADSLEVLLRDALAASPWVRTKRKVASLIQDRIESKSAAMTTISTVVSELSER